MVEWIIFILAIVIIGLLIGVVGVLLQAAWVTWPAWVTAGAVMFTILQLHQFRKNERKDLYILKNIKARFSGGSLNWSTTDNNVASCTNSEHSNIAIIIPASGWIVAILMLVLLKDNISFSGMIFWFWKNTAIVDPDIGAVAGFVATAALVAAIAFFSASQKDFGSSAQGKSR